MKEKGKIIEYTPEKGGYGVILTNNNQKINFEKCECNYDKIRIGDEVEFHLFKSLSNNLDALNIEFVKNKLLSELDSIFQKQIKIECIILKKKNKGLILDYCGAEIYLPYSNTIEQDLMIGQPIMIYIQSFSYNNFIIASQKETRLNSHKDYNKHFERNETLVFQMVDFNNGGVLVSDEFNLGFIPNSHIYPLNKNELNEGQKLQVKIISYNLTTGLKLSVRNHFFAEKIKALSEAYTNQQVLKGILKSTNKLYYSVFFEGFELKMNKEFVIKDNLIDNEVIKFVIVDFNARKDISISNIEITSHGLMQNFCKNNQFLGLVKEIQSEGLIIELNDSYKTCFLPNNEISDFLPWDFDYKRIKIGARIKVSIKKFDYKGIYLSRVLYKKKERRAIASVRYKIGDKFRLKIKERIAKFGVIVADNNIKGVIPLESIIPIDIIQKIDKLDFVKYCNNILKRRSIIDCVIKYIDIEHNKIDFDLDYSKVENIEKGQCILTYFENDKEVYDSLARFYNAKIKQQ
jgi:ribosomal protein S1